MPERHLPPPFRAIYRKASVNPSAFLSRHGCAIYLFHGVISGGTYTVRNYTNKHLQKDQFYAALKELKQTGHPVSMDDIISHYSRGESLPPFAFAVTFDDGFENNYSIAAPLLKDLQIPATFYVTTDFIENNHMSWIDRIELCLEGCGNVSLNLIWDKQEKTFTCNSAARKQAFLEQLRRQVKQSRFVDPELIVEHVFEQCQHPRIRRSDDPLDLKMTWRQVRNLANDDLFTIGGHSHTHPILSFLDPVTLDAEISQSVVLLETKAGVYPVHYSYPEGMAHCYSEGVIQALVRHGIQCCPTAVQGINTPTESLFHLKRILWV